MTNVGIVGAEAAKFDERTEQAAKRLINKIFSSAENPVLVSGGCHLGGVDIWAEEIADELGLDKIIHLPEVKRWNPPGLVGYKERNLRIARDSDELHVIAAAKYPEGYEGMSKNCYHCLKAGRETNHIKSGACWTANEAENRGREIFIHVIE